MLIILATVSINTVLGEGGIIQKAEQAKQMQANATKAEEEAMDELDKEIGQELGDIPKEVTLEEAKQNTMLTARGNSKLTIGDDTVWIPARFKVHEDSAETVDEGIVITDGTNEFVWVPVSEESFGNMFKIAEPAVALSGSTGVTSNYYSNLRVRSGDASSVTVATVTSGAYSTISTGVIREPDLVVGSGGTTYDASTSTTYYSQAGFTSTAEMAQAFVDDYEAMRTSIETYDGFYIGRYELTGTVSKPTVKAGTVLNAETAGNWYYLYKACRNVVTGNSHATSTMIWGCQWDETMNWLKNIEFKDNPEAVDVDSKDWGNYKDVSVLASDGETEIKASGTSTLLETGITTYTMRNKIYDLAGNYLDWTQEANSAYYRVFRGGSCNDSSSSNPASTRGFTHTYNTNSNRTARTTLYVK